MNALTQLVHTQIKERGFMSVAQFMELALSHPEYGYYMKQDPLGSAGDFTTAPEISQIFGELFGAFIAQQWRILGEPAATLVEIGPGRGTLMADSLRISRHVEGFHDSIQIRMVETSPALRERQQVNLQGMHPDITWHETLADLPPKPLLLIANEFFDALPIRQFAGQGKEIRERVIVLEDGKLAFSPDAPVIREHCPAALEIMTRIATHIATYGGIALIADYGYIGGQNAKAGSVDTLQALKKHVYHPVLEDIGDADLTAHVDFQALKDAASNAGASVFGPVTQGMFLLRLGAQVRAQMLSKKASPEQEAAIQSGLHRLVAPEEMGELFKVMCVTGPRHPRPEGF